MDSLIDDIKDRLYKSDWTGPVSYIAIALSTIGLIILFIYGLWVFVIRVDHVHDLVVTEKSWSREIRELQDYTVWVTNYHSREDCSPPDSKGHRSCSTVHWTTNDPETRTRVINQWDRAGKYPDKPRWPEHPPVTGDHYLRQYESYSVTLMDGETPYYWYPGNEAYYDTFPANGKCLGGFNYLGFVIKIEC